jgi:hypothetical protein
MSWFFLIVGIVLFGIGIAGQIFGRSKAGHLHPDDLRARKWVVTVGSMVVGAWLLAISAAHLLSLSQAGRW